MTDTTSSKEQRLRQSREQFWSQLQTAWIHIPVGKVAGRRAPTWEVFSERFERCFRRVSDYVGRRVNDRESFERIVTEVLSGSLDLVIAQCSELEEMKRVKTSADRFLAPTAATRRRARKPPSAREGGVWASQSDERA